MLTGRQAEVRAIPDSDEALVKELFTELFTEKIAYDKPVIVGSRPVDSGERRLEHGLYGSHAYEVTGLTKDGRIELRNPWGTRHPEALTPAEFREYFRRKRPDGTREGLYTTLT